MRLQLQKKAAKALADQEKEHKKLLEEHLNKICNDAANLGLHVVEVKFGCLSDGLPLTGKEVEEFANSSEHPLTYDPPTNDKCATLSWYPETIIGKSVIM